VAEDLERLHEFAVFLPLLEGRPVEEDVVPPADLTGTRRPRGRRERQPRPGLPVEEAIGDGALSGSGRAREDEQDAQRALALEVGEESAPLVGAEAPHATVLADLELLHRAPGLDLPDTG
jgi:hypothetical protein